MDETAADDIREKVDAVCRAESRHAFATLIRRLGDFDLAEEALHDAFRAALEQWPHDGVPIHPRAWLVSVGRFKAIDRMRRRARFDSLEDDSKRLAAPSNDVAEDETGGFDDDLLRLIFTCCHPALSLEAQVALTLREVCGLTTDKWDAMSENERNTFLDECFSYDDVLRKNGHFAGGEALQSARNAAVLRWRNGKVSVTDGPFTETKEQLGGILILEARDLNHAIQLISRHPGVKAGPFEIRPAADLSAMVAQSEQRRAITQRK
jgi:DNA-directed RNA polymerase specialized sigma24 family protein